MNKPWKIFQLKAATAINPCLNWKDKNVKYVCRLDYLKWSSGSGIIVFYLIISKPTDKLKEIIR